MVGRRRQQHVDQRVGGRQRPVGRRRLIAGTIDLHPRRRGRRAPGTSSLVSAVGWQESGHNNSMVSSAGAMGIMQVMPGTWDWVEQNLAGRQLDPGLEPGQPDGGHAVPEPPDRQGGGDEATAIGGYDQGTGSVRRIGMLPETWR